MHDDIQYLNVGSFCGFAGVQWMLWYIPRNGTQAVPYVCVPCIALTRGVIVHAIVPDFLVNLMKSIHLRIQ